MFGATPSSPKGSPSATRDCFLPEEEALDWRHHAFGERRQSTAEVVSQGTNLAVRAETRAWLEENCPASMRTPMPEEETVWGGRHATFKTPNRNFG